MYRLLEKKKRKRDARGDEKARNTEIWVGV
jgi:hypothetical protein